MINRTKNNFGSGCGKHVSNLELLQGSADQDNVEPPAGQLLSKSFSCINKEIENIACTDGHLRFFRAILLIASS